MAGLNFSIGTIYHHPQEHVILSVRYAEALKIIYSNVTVIQLSLVYAKHLACKNTVKIRG